MVSRTRLVAVDEREPAETRPLVPFPAAAGKEARRRANPAGEDEARAERTGREGRKVPAELRRHVRGLSHLGAERVDRARELFPLRLDLAPHLVGGAIDP
jgi:hypothetical protein